MNISTFKHTCVIAVFILFPPMAFAGDQETATTDPALSGIFMAGFGMSLYFIPSLVAKYRLHQQSLAIFILNLFLGWTCLGWVIALIWACTAVAKPDAKVAA